MARDSRKSRHRRRPRDLTLGGEPVPTMPDVPSGVKMLARFLQTPCKFLPRLPAPVDVPVQKWKELNPPFIKRQRLKELRFRLLLHLTRPIALKTGVDNLRATL